MIKTNTGTKTAEVVLTFNEDGSIEKEAIGFEGKSCTAITDFIEKALGAKEEKKRFKPEYLRSNSGPQATINTSI